jgi:CheY-like chemotaxis protein
MSGHGRLTIEAGNASLDEIYVRHNADVTPGQYVMVAVTDFGTGMTPEVRERVFEPFFTTKPEGEGTGLGLSMVYGFVKQSGGHVKIYSELGMGTTVRIYLPREHQEEDRETEVDPGPADGGSETVLVVEDDEDVRATVVEMLLQLGYRVLKARDAQSALAIVESGVHVDLLFSDVVMPGALRSPELARKVRERLPGVAVLFTSGYTDNAIVHSGRLDPGIELLSKPYTLEAMARKIRRVLLKADVDEADAVDARGARLAAGALGGRAAALSVASVGGRKRVLFVEDDELVRASTAELLRTFDVEVIEVADEVHAMQVLTAHSVDILLTDVGLRGASGIDLAMTAKRMRPQLRVIFLSGYEIVLSAAQRAVLPDAPCLRKPYDLVELIAALG